METKKTKKAVAKKVVKLAAKKSKVVVSAKKKIEKHKVVATKKVVKKTKAIPAFKKSVEAKKIGHQKESSLKRATYMFLSVLLGLLLGTFVSLFLELVYMKQSTGIVLQTHYFLGLASYLPFFAQPIILLAGLIFGIWLGFWGWKMVYIERRHRMYRK